MGALPPSSGRPRSKGPLKTGSLPPVLKRKEKSLSRPSFVYLYNIKLVKRSYVEKVIERNTPLYGIAYKKGGSRWNIVLSYQDLTTCSVNHHIGNARERLIIFSP